MKRAVMVMLMGFLLGGCLEEVDPMSNVEGFSTTVSGSVTLKWQPPTQNADGSPLLDLAGYNIYVGTGSQDYDYREIRLDNPGLTAYVVSNLEPGTYFFAATGNAMVSFISNSYLWLLPGVRADGCVFEVPPELHSPIEQQAVLLDGENLAVRQFLAFLRSDKARSLLESAGYEVPD